MHRFTTTLLGALILSCAFFASTSLKAEGSAPATAAEVAYWRTLQGEIATLRSANSSDAKALFSQPLPEINATMARVEDFLDRRDDDPVDELGADLQAYREQLLAMLDSALNPIRAAAKFSEALQTINIQERLEQGTRYMSLINLVDEFKPDLAKLHEEISARIVAGGGPRILFFQNLNLGDKAVVSGEKVSPLERDKRFVEESTAIDPGLGSLAETNFLVWRRDGRFNAELEAKRDQILAEITSVRENAAKMPTASLEKELANLSQDDPTVHAVVGAAIRIELLHRKRQSAAALLILDWKTAFARWLGKAIDDTSIWQACRDVPANLDADRYAYCADGRTVVIRTLDQNTVIAQTTFEGDVRGLAFDAEDDLLVFTTTGLFEWSGQSNATPQIRNSTTSPNVSGRITSAAARNRTFYAWANLPELSENGIARTFRAAGSSSVSALAFDKSGTYIAIGYTGKNNLGNEDKTIYGVSVLALPDSLEDGSISSEKFGPPYIESTTSIAFDDDASHLAIASNEEGRGTVCVFERAKGKASRRVLAIDNLPYHYVSYLPGEVPRVLAAARNGVVRIWNADSGELLNRFSVPTGPQGVAVGVVGSELVSIALGSESIIRWPLDDVAQAIAVAGPQPVYDAAAHAAALAAERGLQATQALFVDFIAADGEEETRIGQAILRDHGAELDQLGRRETIVTAVGNNLADQVEALVKAKKFTEAARIGNQAIADGFSTRSVYYELIYALRGLGKSKEATTLAKTALELYPTSRDIRYIYHLQRRDNFAAANQPEAAMKEIDEIGNIYPDDRPNYAMRQGVYITIGGQAQKAGRTQAAIDAYLKCLDYCRTPKDQLNIFPTLFALAYEVKNWNLTVNLANAWMKLDENKKNDENFMKVARYAYSQIKK
jgi:tetratricopeptide (TPR) repeat protein